MARNRKTGASGRWNGPGKVYLMEKKTPKTKTKNYKIGSSKNPARRLKQIQKSERTRNIKLVCTIKCPRMRSGEGKAQRAVKRMGLKKDKRRGGATDWHYGPSKCTPKRVATTVRNAQR